MERKSPSRFWPLLVVLAVAAGLRVWLTTEHAASPLWDFLRLDEAQYADAAARAATGDLLGDYVRTNAPGYAWFLTPLFAAFGNPLPAVRVVQMLLGLASAALAYFAALRLTSSRLAATAAALLLGLYWPLLIFEQRILSAALVVFLNLAGLFFAVRAATEAEPGKGWRATATATAASGLLFGLAALVVPTSLAAALFVGVGLMFSLEKTGRVRRALVFLAFLALPVLPVVLSDRARSGEWFLLQTNGGLNFYIGNGPESDGTPWARPGGDWDDLTSRPVRVGVTKNSDQDRWFMRAALSAAADDPGRFLKLLGRKAQLALSHREVYATIFPEFHRGLFAATRLPLVNFAVILALAFASIPVLWRKPGALVLLLNLLGFWLALTLTVVSSRYRLPLAAVLCVAAGAGTDVFIQIARNKAAPPTWKFAAGLGLLMFLANSPMRSPFNLPFERKVNSEEWAMLAEAEVNRGDPGRRAESNARQALSLNPENGLAFLQLARAEAMRGRNREALELISQATHADPRSSEAHIQYAFGLKANGDLPGALNEARAAVDAAPQRVAALMCLAEIAAAAGRADEARAALAAVYALRPDFPPARELEQQYQLGPGGAR